MVFLFFKRKEKSFFLFNERGAVVRRKVTFNGNDAKLQVKLWCLSVTVENCVIGHHGIWAIIACSANLLSVRMRTNNILAHFSPNFNSVF